MSEELYYSIIDQLADWNYKGHLTLYETMSSWRYQNRRVPYKYARKQLPGSFIFMSTNGLDPRIPDGAKSIIPYVNQLDYQ